MPAGRPILVTGLHRSGTTWCGRLLSAGSEAYYVHEPFNRFHPPGICPARFDRWFQYVGAKNEDQYAPAIDQTYSLRFSPGLHITSSLASSHPHWHDGVFGAVWSVREWARWTRARLSGLRPLVKDPHALFAAEWIADRYDAQVVVLVRHPAGFVDSVQRADWDFDFRHLAEQNLLMEGVLSTYSDQIRAAVRKPGTLTDRAVLLWSIAYDAVSTYQQRHPDWIVVRNEDLAMRPQDEFASLFGDLALSFDETVQATLDEMTSAEVSGADAPRHSVRRDSEAEAWKWTRNLDERTIRQIQSDAYPVWKNFYSDDEWP